MSDGGKLGVFILITYVVMWVCFGAVVLGVPPGSPLGAALLLLGAFAPGLVAVPLTAATEGASAMRALVARAIEWRDGARYFLFAAGYMAVVKLAAALVHRLAIGSWPVFGTTPWYLLVGALLVSTPFQAGEEIGWRGYALPRLAARVGYARAGLLLGAIWAAWHLPQFFIPSADTYRQSFFVFALQVTALSVAMTWLYLHTGGSLLPVMLMHAAVNNTKDIVPSVLPGGASVFGFTASSMAWLTVALMWLCAAYFLAHMPELHVRATSETG